MLKTFHLFQGFRQSYIRSGPFRSIPSICNQRSLPYPMKYYWEFSVILRYKSYFVVVMFLQESEEFVCNHDKSLWIRKWKLNSSRQCSTMAAKICKVVSNIGRTDLYWTALFTKCKQIMWKIVMSELSMTKTEMGKMWLIH